MEPENSKHQQSAAGNNYTSQGSVPFVPPSSTSTTTPTISTAHGRSSERSAQSKRRLVISVAASIVAIIVIVVVALILSGAFGEIFGGPLSDNSRATVELAEKACTSRGFSFSKDNTDVMESNEDLKGIITGIYSCVPGENDMDNSNAIQFTLMTFNKEYHDIPYITNMINNSLFMATTLENSDSYFKAYESMGSSYAYFAYYKNTSVQLYSYTTDAAETLLAEIGYPDRNHANPEAEAAAAVEKDRSIEAVLSDIVTELGAYATNHDGNYPVPTETTSPQYPIDGSGDTEFDVFYKDYLNRNGNFKDASGQPYVIRALNYASDYYAYAPVISIQYNAACQDGLVTDVADSKRFVVTYLKANGDGYFCYGN